MNSRAYKYSKMATHGALSAFNQSKEPWTAYTERLQYYFTVNDVQSEDKKHAILLSVCGPDTYKAIRSLIDIETLDKAKFEELVNILKSHYDPKPSFIAQRFKFYNRTRATGKTVSTFVAALHQIAEYCKYNETLNDMIRDHLVCGINH